MSKYHYRLINELRMQLCYAPERRRLQQLERLEQLVGEIRAGRSYRYDSLAQKITNYKPSKAPSTKLSGDHLKHDLSILLEDLSNSLDAPQEDQTFQPVFTVDQLKDMFDESPQTIFHWRLDGLPVRYFFLPGGEKEMGVSPEALEKFMGKAVAEAVRSPKFNKAPENKLLARVREICSEQTASLTDLAEKLHDEFGLEQFAAKCIIRQHDAANPETAFFNDTHLPLSAADKQEIFAANRQGTSIQRLTEIYKRTRAEIQRVIRQIKAERIIADGVEFVYNPEFDSPDADEVILKLSPTESSRKHVGRRETHVPAYLTDLCKVPLLGKEEEPDLFRRYNYLKYRLYKLWNQLRPSELTPTALEDMRWLRNEATELRNRILEANLRLVIRMAYKHVGPYANVNELISDGNISLMQAVEKFDYSKGFRFSTYASWALLKNFAKTIPESNYRGEKFVTGQTDLLDTVADPDDSFRREEFTATVKSAINRVMGKLSARERNIVRCRFGMGEEDQAQTLGEVGEKMNVTRERIRQIEARALEKMRVMLKKESIEVEL